MDRNYAGITCKMGVVADGSQPCNICFLPVKLAEVKKEKGSLCFDEALNMIERPYSCSSWRYVNEASTELLF